MAAMLSYPVVLQCQEEFVAVPINTLIQESSVFKALFCTQDFRDIRDIGAKTESEEKEKDNSPEESNIDEGVTDQSCKNDNNNNQDLSEITSSSNAVSCQKKNASNQRQADIHIIIGFNGKAVKIIIDFLKGFSGLLDTCNDFIVIKDMLIFCASYDIIKPITAICDKLDRITISMSNVLDAIAALEVLKDHEHTHVKLLARCVNIARHNIASNAVLLNFLLENKEKSSYIGKLLQPLLNEKEAIIRFKVENFSQIKDIIKSPTFIVRNIPMHMEINKKKETYSTFESVSFLIVPESNPVIPLYNTFILRIINQQGGANMGFTYVWDSPNKQIGNTSFVPFNSVTDPVKHYIKNDSVIFEVSVNLNSITLPVTLNVMNEKLDGSIHDEKDINAEDFELGKLKEPDVSSEDLVVLMCNGVPISIHESILVRESPVFKAMLSENWQSGTNTEELLDANSQDKTNIKLAKNTQLIKVFVINGFNSLAAKYLFDYLIGFKNTIRNCTMFAMLGEMLRLCDFYGITKPVEDIRLRIERIPIKLDNLIDAYDTREALKNFEQFNQISTNLISRCLILARSNLASWQGLLEFVVKNCSKIDSVLKFLSHLRDDDKVALRFRVEGRQNFFDRRSVKSTVCTAKNLEWSVSFDYSNIYVGFKMSCESKSSSTAEWTVKMKPSILTKQSLRKDYEVQELSANLNTWKDEQLRSWYNTSWEGDVMMIEVLIDFEECTGLPTESNMGITEDSFK